MKKFNQGDISPESGFYRVVNLKGKTLYSIYIEKGKRFPPTMEKNCYYRSDY